jgi:hypothetical protein
LGESAAANLFFLIILILFPGNAEKEYDFSYDQSEADDCDDANDQNVIIHVLALLEAVVC